MSSFVVQSNPNQEWLKLPKKIVLALSLHFCDTQYKNHFAEILYIVFVKLPPP